MPGPSPSVVAVVLAGGQGTRIRHLLPDLPKPMAPVLGRPFIEWLVRYLAGQGIGEVVISTGYRAEVIEGYFFGLGLPGVRVSCVAEREPLGTAGGFLQAAASIAEAPEAWLVLNGDSLALAPLGPLFSFLENGSADGALLGLEMADAARYGTLASIEDCAGKWLTGFAEKRPGSGTINAGVYLLRNRLLARFPSQRPLSFETEVFPALLAGEAALGVLPVEAPFLDIGTPETLRQAEGFIDSNKSFFTND